MSKDFVTFKKDWPDWIEYFDFLDLLRESGQTNMFGAAPFLQDEYPDLTTAEAREIVLQWMDHFGEANV